jgi:hypothetical protein
MNSKPEVTSEVMRKLKKWFNISLFNRLMGCSFMGSIKQFERAGGVLFGSVQLLEVLGGVR